jgi:hypothetical protein
MIKYTKGIEMRTMIDNKAASFEEADEGDILQKIRMTP